MSSSGHATSRSKPYDTEKIWLWVIEYCASLEEIDTEILQGLFAEAPQFPVELGKKTRELVAFRCLEELFCDSDKCTNEGRVSSAKVSFDLSLTCEAVLESVLKKKPSSGLVKNGKKLSERDIPLFIKYKRASMPKCALKQLKDAILEDKHPCIATLKEHSGLVHRDDVYRPFVRDVVASEVDASTVPNMASTENLFPVPHENDLALGDDSHDRNVLPRRRDRIELDNEMEDHHNSEAKKHRKDGLLTEQPKDHILATKCGKELVEDNSERMILDNERDDCSVEIELQLGQLEGSRSTDNGHSDCVVVVAGIGQSPDAGGESGHKDHLSEDDTSSDEENNPERIDVLQKKHQFLSSQCPGGDSFSMSYWTEHKLCVKCKKGGQSLVCGHSGCALVIHEKCLGTAANFDDKGDFYCPFCVYTHLITDYAEAKKRASSSRKQLASMFRDCHDPSCRTKENVGKTKRRAHEVQKKAVVDIL